jgi:hypothetical protein
MWCADLRCAILQASSLQKQLELSESEVSRLTESAATAASRLSACQAELAAAKQEAASSRQTAEAARQDVSQVGTSANAQVFTCKALVSLCRIFPAIAHGGLRSTTCILNETLLPILPGCILWCVQACTAVASERQQLRQLESQVARLAGVLRQLLISVSSSGSCTILEPPKSGTAPIMVGSRACHVQPAQSTESAAAYSFALVYCCKTLSPI